MDSSTPNDTQNLGSSAKRKRIPFMPFNLFDETFLVQNAAGTFLSTNPNDDDGGQRAHQELQESLARRPVKLPAFELVELWEKAKADPTSLTEEERLRILERWPLDDFNAKCQAICGMALEELLDKAANSPEDLTREEARMLIYGVEKRSLGDDPNLERLRWPSDLRDLQRKAIAAAETEQDRTALKNAREAQRKGIDRKHEARNILNEDDRKNVVWCNRSSWAKKLDQEQPDQEWGFVLYRTCFEDDQSWRKFQQELANLTNVALTLVKDSEGIRKRWKIHYIEERGLEGTSLETLAEDFRSRISSSASDDTRIPAHLRHDAFLFADREAIKSALEPRPKSPVPETSRRSWVWAADALHTEARVESYKHGFTGSVKVGLPNVLTTLFARLAPRGSEEDKPEVLNKMMQSFDVIFQKAKHDPGKVYPPVSMYNRGS